MVGTVMERKGKDADCEGAGWEDASEEGVGWEDVCQEGVGWEGAGRKKVLVVLVTIVQYTHLMATKLWTSVRPS